jgi:hypothetical protein
MRGNYSLYLSGDSLSFVRIADTVYFPNNQATITFFAKAQNG